jgi:hypothetical protein
MIGRNQAVKPRADGVLGDVHSTAMKIYHDQPIGLGP